VCYCALAARGAELPEAKPEDVGVSAETLALVAPAIQKLIDEKKGRWLGRHRAPSR